MKRAYINGILLDGTQQMEPQAHKVLLCEDGVITAVADEGTDLDGYEVSRIVAMSFCEPRSCRR